VVVLASEIGSGMTVEGISVNCAELSPYTGIRADAHIWMGLCESDILGTAFEDNYVPGSKTLVFQADTLEIDGVPDTWVDIDLQTPFFYDGIRNLLIEVWHEPVGLNHGLYCWNWASGEGRMIWASSQGGDVYVDDDVPWLSITGQTALEQQTFGGIKRVFASP
jgi:hypothetical protein